LEVLIVIKDFWIWIIIALNKEIFTKDKLKTLLTKNYGYSIGLIITYYPHSKNTHNLKYVKFIFLEIQRCFKIS